MAKAQERLTALERNAARHDKEIAAIRKLIITGMKMINALAASQRKTDAELKALIRSMRSGNGNAKRKIDLQ